MVMILTVPHLRSEKKEEEEEEETCQQVGFKAG